VTKRLVDVDDDALSEAERRLGTTTLKDTVNAALRVAADMVDSARDHALARLTEMAKAGDFDVLLDKRNYRR
jgi:Arc/MetJ family transcription regulator